MRNLLVILSFLIVFLPDLSSQERTDSLPGKGTVSLSLKNINFFKDNEYFNPIIEGYTLFGYFIQPAVVYAPSKNISLQLGVHLLNYAGADKISTAKLVFSTTFNFTPGTFFTLGTLNGSDKHRLTDPIFDKERVYNKYAEEGIQFVTGNNHFFNDLWLASENYIFKGDTTREILTLGESFRYSSGLIGDLFKIEVPLQIFIKHYGGQISNYNAHLEEYFNLSTGARIDFDIARKRFGTAGIEYLYFNYNEVIGINSLGVTNGYASWIRFHYTYKPFYFGSYYWRSHDFYAPNGNPVYSSVSDAREGLVISDREIWTNCIYFTFHPYSWFEIFAGYESYFDLNRWHMDNAITLHLRFNQLIRLATLK